MRALLSWRTAKQFLGYAGVGALNTALNFLFINLFIVLTGITSGRLFLFASFCVFFVVIGHSFIWNRYLIFAKEGSMARRKEYLWFFGISAATVLLNILVLHILIDVLGAPAGISAHAWANVALFVAVALSIVSNFLGYKFLVFTEGV